MVGTCADRADRAVHLADDTQPTEPQIAAYVTGYVLLTVGWSLAMLRWMYLNSEVIDLNELLKLKRELDSRKKR